MSLVFPYWEHWLSLLFGGIEFFFRISNILQLISLGKDKGSILRHKVCKVTKK